MAWRVRERRKKQEKFSHFVDNTSNLSAEWSFRMCNPIENSKKYLSN